MKQSTDTAPTTRLPPAQRRACSRRALARCVIARVAHGDSLTTISRRALMPRARTLARWLHEDERFRARVEAARRAGLQAAADEVVALADAYAATAPAKKRSVAVRMQIEARKWWVRHAASELRDERREAHPRAKATPAADKPSTHSIIVQRLREREAELKREADARAARETATNDANASQSESPTAARETHTPEPIPTIVYGWPPPSPSSDAPAAPMEDGSRAAPSAEPPNRETPRAVPPSNPAPPQAPSRSPLVPDWFLEPREPPQRPYDPFDW